MAKLLDIAFNIYEALTAKEALVTVPITFEAVTNEAVCANTTYDAVVAKLELIEFKT